MAEVDNSLNNAIIERVISSTAADSSLLLIKGTNKSQQLNFIDINKGAANSKRNTTGSKSSGNHRRQFQKPNRQNHQQSPQFLLNYKPPPVLMLGIGTPASNSRLFWANNNEDNTLHHLTTAKPKNLSRSVGHFLPRLAPSSSAKQPTQHVLFSSNLPAFMSQAVDEPSSANQTPLSEASADQDGLSQPVTVIVTSESNENEVILAQSPVEPKSTEEVNNDGNDNTEYTQESSLPINYDETVGKQSDRVGALVKPRLMSAQLYSDKTRHLLGSKFFTWKEKQRTNGTLLSERDDYHSIFTTYLRSHTLPFKGTDDPLVLPPSPADASPAEFNDYQPEKKGANKLVYRVAYDTTPPEHDSSMSTPRGKPKTSDADRSLPGTPRNTYNYRDRGSHKIRKVASALVKMNDAITHRHPATERVFYLAPSAPVVIDEMAEDYQHQKEFEMNFIQEQRQLARSIKPVPFTRSILGKTPQSYNYPSKSGGGRVRGVGFLTSAHFQQNQQSATDKKAAEARSYISFTHPTVVISMGENLRQATQPSLNRPMTSMAPQGLRRRSRSVQPQEMISAEKLQQQLPYSNAPQLSYTVNRKSSEEQAARLRSRSIPNTRPHFPVKRIETMMMQQAQTAPSPTPISQADITTYLRGNLPPFRAPSAGGARPVLQSTAAAVQQNQEQYLNNYNYHYNNDGGSSSNNSRKPQAIDDETINSITNELNLRSHGKTTGNVRNKVTPPTGSLYRRAGNATNNSVRGGMKMQKPPTLAQAYKQISRFTRFPPNSVSINMNISVKNENMMTRPNSQATSVEGSIVDESEIMTEEKRRPSIKATTIDKFVLQQQRQEQQEKQMEKVRMSLLSVGDSAKNDRETGRASREGRRVPGSLAIGPNYRATELAPRMGQINSGEDPRDETSPMNVISVKIGLH